MKNPKSHPAAVPFSTARSSRIQPSSHIIRAKTSARNAWLSIFLVVLAGIALACSTNAAEITNPDKVTTSTLVRATNGVVKDSCFDCHLVMEGMSLVFTNDIHYDKKISCATCHGGDPTEPDQNISMNAAHGFKVRATRQAIPQYCGRCHSDADFMGGYDPDLPVDQLAKFTNSVHGKLLAAGRRRAAECVDCHSVHTIRPIDDPLSAASPQRISATCAKCHATTAEAYLNTRHGKLFTTQQRPGCTVCHDAHDTQPATTAMLTGSTSVCTRCHRPGTPAARSADDLARYLASLEAGGPASKDALDRARVAVHSMNLATVKRAAEPATPPPATNAK